MDKMGQTSPDTLGGGTTVGFGQKANFTVLAAMPPKAPKAKKKSPPSGKKNGKKKVAVEAAETTAGFVDNEKPDVSYVKTAVPSLQDGIEVAAPSLLAGHLDKDGWNGSKSEGKTKKAKSRVDPFALLGKKKEEKPPAVSLADIEKDLEAAALAGEAGLMGKSTTADATKPVVFQGKVYQIPAHLTVETVFQNAGLKENAKRQFQLRFDKSPVVLQPRTLALVKAAGLTDAHLRLLRAQYAAVDFSGMGNITFAEFFEYVDFQRSAFSDIVFECLVEKERAGAGTLFLDDFVCVLTVFCTYTKNDILKLLFNLFDIDKSGLIDAAEFKDLTLLVNNGKPMFPGTFAKAFSGLDDNADGSLDFEEFKKMNERFPMVLYPAFQFQDCCIKASLGADEWVKISERLVQLRAIRHEQLMKRHFAPAAKAKAAKPDSTAGWWGRLCRCGKKPVKEEEKEPEEEFDSPEAALNAFDKKAARAVATAAATPSAVTPTAAAGGVGIKPMSTQRTTSFEAAGGPSSSGVSSPKVMSPVTSPKGGRSATVFPSVEEDPGTTVTSPSSPTHINPAKRTVPDSIMRGPLSPKGIGIAFGLKSYMDPEPVKRGPVKLTVAPKAAATNGDFWKPGFEPDPEFADQMRRIDEVLQA